MRRLAEADLIARDRVDACCTACRGLIIVSTLDFLYRERPLGGDLARRQVHDLLHGFGTPHESPRSADGHPLTVEQRNPLGLGRPESARRASRACAGICMTTGRPFDAPTFRFWATTV